MTDQEPNVQVPASLIGEAPHTPGCQIDGLWILPGRGGLAQQQSGECTCWKARFTALLSQPTPTAAMCPDCSEHAFDGRKCVSCDYRVEQDESAEPPRIEDMALGTQFTEEVRWTVTGTLSTGSTVAHSGSGEMRFADRFDPSTIRDVTPPKDAS